MGSGSSTNKKSPGYGAEYEAWLNSRLNHYFNDIDDTILTEKLTAIEIDDLHAAVENIMVSILKEVATLDSRFTVRKSGVVRYGSFYEEASIINPDRFDFLIVVSEFSSDDIIQPVAVKRSNHSLFKVYLKNQHSKDRWQNCLIADAPGKACLRSDIGLTPMFYSLVDRAVGILRSDSRDRLYKTYGRLEIAEGRALSKHGSELRLKCMWNKEMVVTITLTPAVRAGYKQVVKEEQTLNAVIYNAIMRTGSILLVPEPYTDDHFRPSFAEVETHLMLDVLTRSHKRVFKILKFLVNGYSKEDPEDIEIFSTEALRTFAISHDLWCLNNRSDHQADCVMVVISYMQNLLTSSGKHGLFLPSVFNKRVNILTGNASNPTKEVLEFNKAALDKVAEHLVTDVGSAKTYDFGKLARLLIPIRENVKKADQQMKKSKDISRGKEADIPKGEKLKL